MASKTKSPGKPGRPRTRLDGERRNGVQFTEAELLEIDIVTRRLWDQAGKRLSRADATMVAIREWIARNLVA